MCTGDVEHNKVITNNPDTLRLQLPTINGVRTETMAQAGRLYASSYLPENSLVMTCDVDLIPLSDYWHPQQDAITVYGHDLTDYTYYPMGYVAMKKEKWEEVMMLSANINKDMERDFDLTKAAYSDNWETWWNVDWDLLTKRLEKYKNEIRFINRGRRSDAPFAFGRIDRGDSMKWIEAPHIDMHCENNNVYHPDKLNKFLGIWSKLFTETPIYEKTI